MMPMLPERTVPMVTQRAPTFGVPAAAVENVHVAHALSLS